MTDIDNESIQTMMQVVESKRRRMPLTLLQRKVSITTILLLVDAILLAGAFILAYVLRFHILAYYSQFDIADYLALGLWSIPAFLILFSFSQLYDHKMLFSGLGEYTRIFSAITAGVMLLITVDFIYRGSTQLSRGWLMLYWSFSLIMVTLWRFGFRRLIYSLRRHGHLLSPAVIVGGNTEGAALAEQLRHSKESGLFLLGFIDENLAPGTIVSNGYRVLGGFDALENVIVSNDVQEVIVAHTALDREALLSVFRMVSPIHGLNLRLSSGLYEIITTGLTVKEMASVPLVEVNKTRISGIDAFLKKLMDYGVSIIVCLLFLPVFGLISIIIKAGSPGPVIHRRRVMGTNGKQFDAFKFRTMRVDGDEILEQYPKLKEELDQNYKLKDDPRVTKFGKFLRQYSLDELPQFVNILRGEMSLVGPRMISPPEMEKYDQWGMNLLTVKPGITGLWQVNGRSDISYEERVQMDMQYIRNWTLGLDIYLILMTVPAVINKRGAY